MFNESGQNNSSVGGFIVLIIIFIIISRSCSCSSTKPKNKPDVGDNVYACMYVRYYVQGRLVSPGSAKFPDCWAQRITFIEPNKWEVLSYVDSQNSFGGLMRSNYDIVLKYLGNDKYDIDEVKEFTDGGQQ